MRFGYLYDFISGIWGSLSETDFENATSEEMETAKTM